MRLFYKKHSEVQSFVLMIVWMNDIFRFISTSNASVATVKHLCFSVGFGSEQEGCIEP